MLFDFTETGKDVQRVFLKNMNLNVAQKDFLNERSHIYLQLLESERI